ncbi:MAG: hypothetical protein ACI8SE_002139 [Bacteroidia bacterium]|jgi:hypothetical protein
MMYLKEGLKFIVFLMLDFDAEKSIIQQGNKNDYLLKPVLKEK